MVKNIARGLKFDQVCASIVFQGHLTHGRERYAGEHDDGDFRLAYPRNQVDQHFKAGYVPQSELYKNAIDPLPPTNSESCFPGAGFEDDIFPVML